MPTLLQVNVTANRGSHGRIAEDIGRLAIEKGWRSILAYGRAANPSKNELIRIGRDLCIREHGLESRILDNHGLASRYATLRFLKQVSCIKPDIIHLHNIHGYYVNYDLLFKFLRDSRIPVIWTLHDCWPFTGHCAYFDFVECDKWKSLCQSPCPCKHSYPKSVLIDASQRNYRKKRQIFGALNNLTLVPVSYWLEGLIKQSFLGKYPIKVIHNGIDINLFQPSCDRDLIRSRYGIEGEMLILGVANVWEERKGMRDFLNLRNVLPEQYDIALVGVTPKQMKQLPSGIIGICRTQNQQELAQLYSCADIYLNLTYEDNYPTTNLEAMACGTPVLTYNTGGSPESVTEDTGWVLEPGNIKGVVDVIKKLSAEDNVQKRKRSDACRNKAIRAFNKANKFLDYFDIYESLL